MAWLIHPNGEQKEVKPTSGKKFKLNELQAFVGGYIEGVYVRLDGKKRRAYVNEEGWIEGLPFNRKATAMLTPEYRGNSIAGTMIVMLPGEGG